MFFTVVAETRTAIIFGLHLTNSQKAEQKGCQNILHHYGAVQVELRVVRLYSYTVPFSVEVQSTYTQLETRLH